VLPRVNFTSGELPRKPFGCTTCRTNALLEHDAIGYAARAVSSKTKLMASKGYGALQQLFDVGVSRRPVQLVSMVLFDARG
jgi:hypothetical protein